MRVTLSLSSLILAFAATAGASNITFFDGTFTPGSWVSSVATNVNTTSSSNTFAQVSTGGDPTFYENDIHSFTGTNAGMRFLNDSAYSFSGSFDSLSYSYNLLDPGTLNVGYSIAILQGGNVFAGPIDTVTANTSAWTSAYTGTNLTAASFCEVALSSLALDCTTHPVFTGNTAATSFGYIVANSFIGTGTGNYHSGIDNWSVTLVNASPEPSSMVLSCAGGLLFAVWRLRKRPILE